MRVLAVLVLFVAAGCGSGPGVSGDLRNVGSVTVTLKVEPARVQIGRPVRMTLRLVNNGGRIERLRFPSAKKYDFWVTRNDEEVWRWSDDRVFTQAQEQQEIGPQSGISFAESWKAESVGDYVVHGTVTAEDYGHEITGQLEVT